MTVKKENTNPEVYSKSTVTAVYKTRQGFTDMEMSVIEDYFSEHKNASVLDIGCGCGRTTVAFNQRGFNVTGVDISENMIREAKRLSPDIDYRIMDACKLEFDDSTFDFVFFSFNGIDEIFPYEKRIDVYKEVFRVLRPGGIFIFSCHNSFWLNRSGRDILSFLYRLVTLQSFFYYYRYMKVSYGTLLLYFSNPLWEKSKLRKYGFNVTSIEKGKPQGFRLTQPYLHYIAKK